jgi:hypothetical protein
VFVALVIENARRMRLIILSVACLELYHIFPNYKRHDFRENVIERKMCVLIFSTTFLCNFPHSENNSVIYYHKFGVWGGVVVKALRY